MSVYLIFDLSKFFFTQIEINDFRAIYATTPIFWVLLCNLSEALLILIWGTSLSVIAKIEGFEPFRQQSPA